MSQVQELLERNKSGISSHQPIPTLREGAALGMKPPATLILTCGDPRCNPHKFLHFDGREALVLRNVGGHVGPALDDIITLDGALGLNEIMVIQHTDCGILSFDDEKIRQKLKANFPGAQGIDTREFGTRMSIEQSIKDDMALLRGSSLIRKELAEASKGYIFDMKTGLVEVTVA